MGCQQQPSPSADRVALGAPLLQHHANANVHCSAEAPLHTLWSVVLSTGCNISEGLRRQSWTALVLGGSAIGW